MGRRQKEVQTDIERLAKFLAVRKGRTIKEIMDFTGRSRATVDRWLNNLPLEGLPEGKKVRWRLA